jgi:hypothetical protein
MMPTGISFMICAPLLMGITGKRATSISASLAEVTGG